MELEEFEFKPLTEGLGFHKKAEATTVAKATGAPDAKSANSTASTTSTTNTRKAKSEPPAGASAARAPALSLELESESGLLGAGDSTRPMSKSISDLIASLPPSLDFTEDKVEPAKVKAKPEIELNMPLPDGARPQIFQPFAREDLKVGSASGPTIGSALGSTSATLPPPGSPVMPSPFTPKPPAAATPASSPYRERLDESFARAFPHAAGRAETREAKDTAKRQQVEGETGQLEAIPSHLGAGFLDAMIVTGISTIFLVVIILITHINLWGLLTNAQTDRPTQIHIALLFLSVLQMYLLTARSFFGASLGEWAFDLQLGAAEDQRKTAYPLRVAWRTLLMTATGLLLLPLLSLVFRRDLAKSLTGLQLYRRI